MRIVLLESVPNIEPQIIKQWNNTTNKNEQEKIINYILSTYYLL